MATCFIALVPLVEESYNKALEAGSVKAQPPYAELTILSGFFLVIFIEQVVTIVQQLHAEGKSVIAGLESS